jgi:hypothetical protein
MYTRHRIFPDFCETLGDLPFRIRLGIKIDYDNLLVTLDGNAS